ERPGTTVSPGPTTPAAAASGDRRTRTTAAGGQVTWRSPATTASPPPGAGRSGTSTGDTATSGTAGCAGGCHSASRATAGWSASVTTSTNAESAATTVAIPPLRYLHDEYRRRDRRYHLRDPTAPVPGGQHSRIVCRQRLCPV